jgi:predicted nucleic acid-binding protein
VALHRIGPADARCRGGGAAFEARTLTLVVDASVAVVAALTEDGFSILGDETLVAPSLMWSEARSALHELLWRGEISADDALAGQSRLETCPVAARRLRSLGERAWQVADQFGWAKTYDAEYVALAQLLGCRLVTLDARLHRATESLSFVVSPSDLDIEGGR